MRPVAVVAVLVGMAGLLGCNVRHDIRVRVRDPRAVRLELATPAQPRLLLLPPGDAPLDALVPTEGPARATSSSEGPRAVRLATGAIELRCPGCAEYPEMEALDATGTIAITHADDVGSTIRWAPDGLHVRFVHLRMTRSRRGRRARAAFEVTLVTPADNVVEVTDHRTASRHDAESQIGLSVAFFAVAAVELGVALGAHMPIGPRAALTGASAGWAGLGAVGMSSGIEDLTSVDTTVRLYPR
jgi:hypothetical protein